MTSAPTLDWTLEPFDALSAPALYEALALRQSVFVVEQRCAYLDCDGLDPVALHLFGRRPGDAALLAYARLLPPGVTYAEGAFGRVLTHPTVRGTGVGRALVRQAIDRMRERFPGPVRIGAQAHLVRLYADFGFVSEGEPYDEDGIPHVEMVLQGA